MSAMQQKRTFNPLVQVLLITPLLILAPAGSFLASYGSGTGFLAPLIGPIVSLACMLILPWFVAAIFLIVEVDKWTRVQLYVAALAAQWLILFYLMPPGGTAEMMGIAHRLKRIFPPEQMQACADELRQKALAGTLRPKPGVPDADLPSGAVAVTEADLPSWLRGRFSRVYIKTDSAPGEAGVYFEFAPLTGIACDHRKPSHNPVSCPMGEGVYAYRYLRG